MDRIDSDRTSDRRSGRPNDPAEDDGAMLAEYRQVVEDDGSELSEEQVQLLVGLGCGRNRYALRRLVSHLVDIGESRSARVKCFDAACMGDTETALLVLTDPRLSEAGRCDDFLGARFERKMIVGAALEKCKGFEERAVDLTETSVLAAEVMSESLRMDERHGHLYQRCLENGLWLGSPLCMHLRASDILYPGFGGAHVENLDEALDLLRRGAEGHWRPALVMGQLLLTGRYVDRDPERALEYIARSCRMTDEAPPRHWLRFMTEDPGEVSDEREPEGPGAPFTVPDLYHLPEWNVLRDVTASWGGVTQYEPFSDRYGCFENDVFVLGEGPVSQCFREPAVRRPLLWFKPTGFRILDLPRRCHVMTEGLTEADLRRLLRICIASAMDDIRGLGA